MSDYVESHLTLADHPKLRRFCRLLSIEDVAAVGHLHFLWYWAFRYAPDGDLTKFDSIDIADAARWKGDDKAFVDALLSCGIGGGYGFLEKSENGDLLLHDWQSYGGKLHVKRQKHAENVRNSRVTSTVNDAVVNDSEQKQPLQVTTLSRDTHVTVTTESCEALEEKRREEKRGEYLSRPHDSPKPFGADAPGETDFPSKEISRRPAFTPDDKARDLIAAYRSVRFPKLSCQPTKTEWMELKNTAKRMVSDGFTEEQVQKATAAMIRRFREIEMCTFFALAKHWAALTEADSIPAMGSPGVRNAAPAMYRELTEDF